MNFKDSGFRVCVKELYLTRYDPVSVSYAVLTGQLINRESNKLTVCFHAT